MILSAESWRQLPENELSEMVQLAQRILSSYMVQCKVTVL